MDTLHFNMNKPLSEILRFSCWSLLLHMYCIVGNFHEVLISYVHSAYENKNYKIFAWTFTSPLAVNIIASFASLSVLPNHWAAYSKTPINRSIGMINLHVCVGISKILTRRPTFPITIRLSSTGFTRTFLTQPLTQFDNIKALGI